MTATRARRERPTSAVVWRVGDAESCSGRLELDRDAHILSGTRAPRALRVPLGDITSVSIGRRQDERIDGVKSLVVERRGGARLLVYIVGAVGALGELYDLLSAAVGAG